MSKCRSCGAKIIWAETEGGSRVPLDAKPLKRYVLKEIETGIGETDIVEVPVVELRSTYVSHFVTCPDADKFRKKKN